MKKGMTKEEMRVAVAEKCGWIVIPTTIAQEFDCTGTPPNNDSGMRYHQVPNYPEDLSAMHEAENEIPREERDKYIEQLWGTYGESKIAQTLWNQNEFSRVLWWCLATATASQRAEAFCRVFWPERF